MKGKLNTLEISQIKDVLNKLGFSTSEEDFEYTFSKGFDSYVYFDIESREYDGSLSLSAQYKLKYELSKLDFVDYVDINTYSYIIQLELSNDYIIANQGDILENNNNNVMKKKSIFLFEEYVNNIYEEDGGGGDFGGTSLGGTPGAGNPDPGGASGDGGSMEGSGDRWDGGFHGAHPMFNKINNLASFKTEKDKKKPTRKKRKKVARRKKK